MMRGWIVLLVMGGITAALWFVIIDAIGLRGVVDALPVIGGFLIILIIAVIASASRPRLRR